MTCDHPAMSDDPQRPLFLPQTDDPATMRPGVIVVDSEPGIDETLWTDDSGNDYTGWFCVATDPWGCPAEGCAFVAHHMTAAHLIIVWPENDDPSLLRHAAHARKVGRNPKVISYEPGLGPACSFYQWEAAGHPVHGFRAE